MPPAEMTLDAVLSRLKSMGSEANRQGMARFGINADTALGIKVTELRKLAKEIGRDHALALQLWGSGFHEARMLATIIDEPKQVSETQAENWVLDLNSWDITDGFTGNLIDKTKFAYEKSIAWSEREEEFVRRAGFALMAWLPLHDKKVEDAKFEIFYPQLEKHAHDDRIYVRKAISWALRNLGKRSFFLNERSTKSAQRIALQESKSAKWIASDVLRELGSEKVLARLQKKANN